MQTVQAVQRDPGKTENTRRIEALVQAALLLREALAALPALATALAPAQSELLKAVRLLHMQPASSACYSSRCSGDIIERMCCAQVRSNFGHPSFAELLESLSNVLDDDAHSGKSAFVSRTQQWCALGHPLPSSMRPAKQKEGSAPCLHRAAASTADVQTVARVAALLSSRARAASWTSRAPPSAA